MPLGVLTLIHNLVLAILFGTLFAVYGNQYDLVYLATVEFG